MINGFTRPESRFLSNFEPCRVEFEGIEYPSVEHAYQAAKAPIFARLNFKRCATPGATKRLARSMKLPRREDSLEIMYALLKQKFSAANPELLLKLEQTGDAELIEENWWGDRFWGTVRGVGENHLGKLLMRVRMENRREPAT